MPGNRTQVDDRAAAGLFHSRGDELRAEEDMPEVHRDPLLPICRSHFLEPVPVVIRGVVHQHRNGSRLGFDGGDRGPQRIEIRHIRIEKLDAVTQPGNQCLRLVVGDIEEEDRDFWRAKPSTITSPMPEPPPVMTTVFPASEG